MDESRRSSLSTLPSSDDEYAGPSQVLLFLDWDDTLFPTSAWKERIKEGSQHPPRASQVRTLSDAIGNLIRTLQQHAEVKLVTHGTKSWYEHSSSVLVPEVKALLDTLDHRYRDFEVTRFEEVFLLLLILIYSYR